MTAAESEHLIYTLYRTEILRNLGNHSRKCYPIDPVNNPSPRRRNAKKQWTDSNLGKEYIEAVYCHSAYLTYVQSISYEMLS